MNLKSEVKKYRDECLTMYNLEPMAVCPICGSIGSLYHKYNYCPECGQRIKAIPGDKWKALVERVKKLSEEDVKEVTVSGANGWNDVRGIFEGLLKKKEKGNSEILEGQMNLFESEEQK